MTVIVKVLRIPGAVKEVGLEEGATVADALAAAEMQVGGTEGVTLDGVTASMNDVVVDGSRLILAKAAKSA